MFQRGPAGARWPMTRGIFDPDQPDRAPPDLAAGRRDPKELSDGGHLGSRADHDRIGHRNVVSFECHALAAFAVGTRDHLLLGGDHVAPGLDQVGRIIRRATSYPLVQPGTPGLAGPGCQGPPGNEAIGPAVPTPTAQGQVRAPAPSRKGGYWRLRRLSGTNQITATAANRA